MIEIALARPGQFSLHLGHALSRCVLDFVGAGTIPALLVIGLGAGALSVRVRQTMVRVAGVFIIIVGVQLALRGLAAMGALPHLQLGRLLVW